MTDFVRVGRRWINLDHVDIVSFNETSPDQPNVTLHFGSQRVLALKDADAEAVFAILGHAARPGELSSR